ncbi:MAG: hypothetical protein HZY76_08595 [Anaerolineae bacterium]|nr:MAG: hypothetical protein HZY76_08595 [Anaerolineae bacterium]
MQTDVAQGTLLALDDETLAQLFVEDVVRYNQAFDILVARYQDRVYGLCLRMMRNAEEAEDQAQEVFIKIYRFLGRFEGRPASAPGCTASRSTPAWMRWRNGSGGHRRRTPSGPNWVKRWRST